eukprot:g39508.t1
MMEGTNPTKCQQWCGEEIVIVAGILVEMVETAEDESLNVETSGVEIEDKGKLIIDLRVRESEQEVALESGAEDYQISHDLNEWWSRLNGLNGLLLPLCLTFGTDETARKIQHLLLVTSFEESYAFIGGSSEKVHQVNSSLEALAYEKKLGLYSLEFGRVK